MNWDDFKSWTIVVSTMIVALCAILTLILRIIEKYPIRIGLKEKIAVLKGIKEWLQIDLKKIARGVIASGLLTRVMVVAITIGITALFLDNLLPVILGEVVKKEVGIIGQEIKKDILQDIREVNEKVLVTLADSEALRKVVYNDALEQADDKGYIILVSGFYMTSYNWRDQERRLLTMSERRVIEEFLVKHGEQDLYRLMHLVLSDDKMIAELTRKEAYDVEIYVPSRVLNRSEGNTLFPKAYDKITPIGKYLVASKKHTTHLTPYDKIGIIGGYIGELRYTTLTKN